MSGNRGFNQRGRGDYRGGGRGNSRGGSRGGYGGGYSGGRGFENSSVVECGKFMYLANDSAVYKLSSSDGVVPLTQTFLMDANKNRVGKVGDVFGPITDVYFNCCPDDPKFLKGLKEGDKIYAPSDRLKPEAFFLDDQPAKRGGRGGGRGRGGPGGRGAPRGGGRGRGRF